MKEIKQLPDLTHDELIQLHLLMQKNKYSVEIKDNAEFPVGIYPELLKLKTIRCRTNDPNPEFRAIHLHAGDWSIPVSIFVQSKKSNYQTMFLLGGNLQSLFMVSRDKFREYIGGDNGPSEEDMYTKLLTIRIELIRRLFQAYQSYDDSMEAFMWWDIRGKRSITRSIAEELGYHRTELEQTEFYYKNIDSVNSYNFQEIVERETACQVKARKRYHLEFLFRMLFQKKKIKVDNEKYNQLIPNYCVSFSEAMKLEASKKKGVLLI